MYVCMYVCTYVYMYVCVHICIPANFNDSCLKVVWAYMHLCYVFMYAALKPSWNPAGVEPGNQEGPGC